MSQLKLFHCNTTQHAIQCFTRKNTTNLLVCVEGGLWMSFSDYATLHKKKHFLVDQATFGFCLP